MMDFSGPLTAVSLTFQLAAGAGEPVPSLTVPALPPSPRPGQGSDS
jgi:hypothetical protein